MDLSGTGPAMQLSSFACASCGLSGTLPAWGAPGRCLNDNELQFFDISFNVFSGSIPSSFGSFGLLGHFNISHTNLLGTVPISCAASIAGPVGQDAVPGQGTSDRVHPDWAGKLYASAAQHFIRSSEDSVSDGFAAAGIAA